MGIIDFGRKAWESVLTVGKVALKSRSALRHPRGNTELPHRPVGGSVIVMGNGPSLRDVISEQREQLMQYTRMAVNFAANAPEFFELKPAHYILADPHFFTGVESDPNVRKLWDHLSKADWGMTLHIPAQMRNKMDGIMNQLSGDRKPRIEYFNMTPADGFDDLCHLLFRNGLAMPRPRNVLIPAIMQAMAIGYDEIYIVGADHTWPHSLYVDDRNRVVTVQPHFYKDNEEELDRVAEAYAGVRIHEVLQSMAIAFRSYHQIRKFADKTGVKIFNATKGSLIDAFMRKPLPGLK